MRDRRSGFGEVTMGVVRSAVSFSTRWSIRQLQHSSLTIPSERYTRPFQKSIAVSDGAVLSGLQLEPLQSTASSTSPIAGGIEAGTALWVRPHGAHDLAGYFDICHIGTEVYNPKWTLPVPCVRTIRSSLCWRISLSGVHAGGGVVGFQDVCRLRSCLRDRGFLRLWPGGRHEVSCNLSGLGFHRVCSTLDLRDVMNLAQSCAGLRVPWNL